MPKKEDIKILVVDNHPQVATEISTNLSMAGYNVLEVDNKNDAIKACKDKHPDIIIVDKETISVDCMDHRKIILTGFNINKTEFKKYNNIVGYLDKPISKSDLLKEIDRVFKLVEK